MTTSILLVSAGIVHPPKMGRFWLRRGLESLPDTVFRRVQSLEALAEFPSDEFDGIVLYMHQERVSIPALDRLEEFVREGGGLLALHSASASFKEQPGYFDILGGRFVDHGPVEPFLVRPTPVAEGIFGEVDAFSVRDELYRHEFEPENAIHFYTMVDGEREPVVWTRRFGAGRVCYCSLGHTGGSMRHPAVRRIVRQGLVWACGEGPEPELAE